MLRCHWQRGTADSFTYSRCAWMYGWHMLCGSTKTAILLNRSRSSYAFMTLAEAAASGGR